MLEFKTEKFQGPLGLLLKLIEKEELDITEIGLAKIADQYINYIKESKDIKPGSMANFLLVAAKLLYIKSKALLPYLYNDEEEEDIAEFENQLRMYKEFLEASKKIEGMISKKKFLFIRDLSKLGRKSRLVNVKTFSPPKSLTKEVLKKKYGDIISLAGVMEEKLEEKVMEYEVSVDEKICHVQKMLLDKIRFSFNRVFKDNTSKTEIVVCFLAVLELAKQREITIQQDGLFQEIFINPLN